MEEIKVKMHSLNVDQLRDLNKYCIQLINIKEEQNTAKLKAKLIPNVTIVKTDNSKLRGNGHTEEFTVIKVNRSKAQCRSHRTNGVWNIPISCLIIQEQKQINNG